MSSYMDHVRMLGDLLVPPAVEEGKTVMRSQTAKLTNEEIIRKHDPSCRGRAYIELQIVDKLIESANALDYSLGVAEYEEGNELDYDFKSAVFDLDVATIYVDDRHGQRVGWILLVFGNGGYDLVSDYSDNELMSKLLEPVNAVSEFWGG